MRSLIENFSTQVRDAIIIGENTPLKLPNKKINSILVCGLGGSGIGGKIVYFLSKSELKIPFDITNDYSIPEFVNENTLVIASSYSGNTEETIAAVQVAQNRNAEIVVISSGGELLNMAKQNQWNHYIIPSGEQPRAMLAYSLIQQLYILTGYKLTSSTILNNLNKVNLLIEKNEDSIKSEAKSVAKSLFGKTPVIYSGADFEGVAIRFRQQINENAKQLCWHHVIPEMNHNELVGWNSGNDQFAVVKLNSNLDFYRTQKRWDICKEIISKKTNTLIEIYAKGDSHIEQVMYFIHLTDWVSFFLAELKKVDAVEVDVIIKLKAELAKIK